MADEKEMGVPFPVAGIDLSTEFSRQPPMTTPEALNVRSFDTLTERGRGGSRPGLTKFIDATVNGVSAIQHITILVDPQEPALPDAESPVGDNIPDPSDNGRNLLTDGSVRLVRRGGSGNRHHVKPASSGSGSTFKQSAFYNDILFDTSVRSLTLPAAPNVDDLLIVVVSTLQGVVGNGLIVKTGAGTSYTQVGAYVECPPTFDIVSGDLFSSGAIISMWTHKAAGGSQDTVTVEPGQACGISIGFLNYSPSTQFVATDATQTHLTDSGIPTSFSTGSVTANSANGLVVAAFTTDNFTFPVFSTAVAPMSKVMSHEPSDGEPTANVPTLTIIHRIKVANGTVTNPTITTPGYATDVGQPPTFPMICGIAATFKS